ncbi:MAG: reverse transcriptase domain-containing protein, partial [Bacteroidota bacterium]
MRQLDDKIGSRITKLSPVEANNWKKWKLSVIKHIVRIKGKPKPLDLLLTKGIEQLKSMNIVIKQADKNLGLVPIRGDIYTAMVRKWTAPPAFRREILFPHADIISRMSNIIRHNKAINEEKKEKWLQYAQNATEPCPFYAIPKIHKGDLLASRPISAQHSYILAPLSQELSSVLLAAQKTCTGITTDTVSFINRIESTRFQSSFVMMTYDVEACYPSIDINDAIKTLHDNIPVMRKNNSFWTKILQLIMYNNYVTTNGQLYRQMEGTATGTQVAPQFANLYLYFKFRSILERPSILLHERFIDDGFVLTSSEVEAETIINQLINCT